MWFAWKSMTVFNTNFGFDLIWFTMKSAREFQCTWTEITWNKLILHCHYHFSSWKLFMISSNRVARYVMLCYAKPRIYYPFEYIWNEVNEVNVWENRTIKEWEWNTIIELQVKWTWMNHRESKRVKLVLSW